MDKQCILCGSRENKVVFREFEDDIVKCEKCGHHFSSYEAKQEYDGYFGESLPEKDVFWWNEAHKNMYDKFLSRYVEGKKRQTS